MKSCLVEKKRAFLQCDKVRMRELQKVFKRKTKLAKIRYKGDVKKKLTSGNAREAWQGLNIMMGRETKPVMGAWTDPASLAEQLNIFFTLDPPTPNPPTEALNISEHLVTSVLCKVNPNKAAGPDRLRGRVLKDCSTQLGGVFTRLFQHLLDSGVTPEHWKESTIIAIPKKSKPSDLKDYRPVALTSILCKCMERVVCHQPRGELEGKLDPLQVAYRTKRGTDDGCLMLLDTVTRQLDSKHPHTRILFMDFLSAFNTVNNNTLLHCPSDLEIHPTPILWIKNFLMDRPQHVLLMVLNPVQLF